MNKLHPITITLYLLITTLFHINLSKATTIFVNQDCNLGDAITSANTDQATGLCIAGNGPDEIIFEQANTVINVNTGTYPSQLGGLSSLAFPTILTNISIDGRGLQINADSSQNLFRIFDLLHPGKLILKNTSITGAKDKDGFAGAIVSLAAEVQLFNCQFSNNFIAIYIADGGTIGVENSLFEGNITTNEMLNSPALQIDGSTAFITNSSFIDNHVNIIANALNSPEHVLSGGIGIRNFHGGRVSIINSTISGNSSIVGGGITFSQPIVLNNETINKKAVEGFTSLEIINSTITNNTAESGGGLFFYDSNHLIQIKNTIIAGNHSKNELGREIFAEDNVAVELNHFNLVKNHLFSDTISTSLGSSDLIVNHDIDEIIDPISSISGFKIHNLKPKSPAIDAADSVCDLNLDQIGNMRPIDGDLNNTIICDIGAIEFNPSSNLIFSNGFDTL